MTEKERQRKRERESEREGGERAREREGGREATERDRDRETETTVLEILIHAITETSHLSLPKWVVLLEDPSASRAQWR